ncbi:response regulator [Methylocystis echinoides]|uniref:ATP-binding response regulator n=1 Tax=Methylocystis echinoides TaxID=29468 RepID=UPI0034193E0B
MIPSDTRTYRILIVDDSPEDRAIYRRFIQTGVGSRYEVEEAECGEEGLRLCRAVAPDCVLLDYNLPDLDGLEFLQAVGGDAEFPIVFLTGQGSESVAVRAMKEGAYDYLIKNTVTVESLRYALRGAIEGSQLRREIERQRTALAAQAEALREADRRKDEFLAMLAHELRNPLAPIRNMAGVLRRLPLEISTVKIAAATIERQVAQMTRIVDDLLDVSRIAHGRLAMRKEPCDLTALVRNAVEDARGPIEERGLRLATRLPEEALQMLGDRHRLSQALHNLLHNAKKFTPAGGTVTVTLEAQAGWAKLVVADTGVGVAEDLLPHIFDAFRQGPQTLERSGGGLGLGLALVRSVALLHGGDVSVATLEGQGASFELRLPLIGVKAGALDETPAFEPIRCRILLIEDDSLVGETTRLLLEVMGHEVRLSTRGDEAVALAQEFRPDFVLCDIGLPGRMDGYAVATALRKDPGFDGAQLVALSGYGHAEALEEARAAGFDRHLTKPVGEETLVRLLAGEK